MMVVVVVRSHTSILSHLTGRVLMKVIRRCLADTMAIDQHLRVWRRCCSIVVDVCKVLVIDSCGGRDGIGIGVRGGGGGVVDVVSVVSVVAVAVPRSLVVSALR